MPFSPNDAPQSVPSVPRMLASVPGEAEALIKEARRAAVAGVPGNGGRPACSRRPDDLGSAQALGRRPARSERDRLGANPGQFVRLVRRLRPAPDLGPRWVFSAAQAMPYVLGSRG